MSAAVQLLKITLLTPSEEHVFFFALKEPTLHNPQSDYAFHPVLMDLLIILPEAVFLLARHKPLEMIQQRENVFEHALRYYLHIMAQVYVSPLVPIYQEPQPMQIR